MDITVGANLEKIFAHHPPGESQGRRHVEIRQAGLRLALRISDLCPDSAEKTLALRKIQEAVMWANAAIAINE